MAITKFITGADLKLNNCILLISAAFGLFFPQSVLAGGGTGDVEEKKNHSTSSKTLQNISSPEQPKFYDNYNTNHNSDGATSNTLIPPNCIGSCFYAIGRFKHTLDGGNTTEILIGGHFDSASPNKTVSSAYANSMKVRDRRMAQEDDISLMTTLADAISKCQIVHARTYSMLVAHKFKTTPEQIISKFNNQLRNCNSSSNTVK